MKRHATGLPPGSVAFLGLGLVMVGLLLSACGEMERSQPALDDYETGQSATWNLPFVHVTGDNWTAVAAMDWCSGNGSAADPYLLENITINAGSAPGGTGIWIKDSKAVHFTIKNCIVYNGQHGLHLENTSLGTVMLCSFSGNTLAGIRLTASTTGNTITSNTCNENGQDGITASVNCSHNVISFNNAIDNGLRGIILTQNSSWNLLEGNNVSDTRNVQDYGIYLSSSHHCVVRYATAASLVSYAIILSTSHNNTIEGSVASQSYHGIYLNGADGNLVRGNTCNQNTYNGIYIYSGSEFNTISDNEARLNNDHGVHVNYGDNNTVEGNRLHDNVDDGIRLENGANGNVIARNNASNTNTSNQNNGIYVGATCIDAMIVNNSFSGHSANGMQFFSCSGVNVTGNTMRGNTASGISVSNVQHMRAVNNTFIGEGIHFMANPVEYYTPYVIENNTVNARPLYYHINMTGIGPANLTGAGAIILVNCTGAIVSNMNLSTTTVGVHLINTNDTVVRNLTMNLDRYALVVRDRCRNITIDGLNVTNTNSGFHLATGISNVTIERCTMSGIPGYQVYMSNVSHATIRGNRLVGNPGTGIYLGSMSSFNTIDNNSIIDSGNYGIYVTSGENNTIVNNYLDNANSAGIMLTGAATRFTLVENNTCTLNRYGVQVQSATYNIIHDNSLVRNDQNGIYIYNADFNLVANNTIRNNLIYGILLESSADGNVIEGNYIGNIAGTDQDYGVRVLTSGAGNVVRGNTFANHTSSGVYLASIPTGQQVTGNEFINDVYGVYLSNTNGSVFSGNVFTGCGFYFASPSFNSSSIVIGTDNLVNDKPVYYLHDRTGLSNVDVPGAGQILLVNCQDAVFSDLDVSNTTTGILAANSSNIFLGTINANGSAIGFTVLQGSNNVTIMNSNASGGSMHGVYCYRADFLNVSGGMYNNKGQASFSIHYSINATVHGASGSGSRYGMYLYQSTRATVDATIFDANTEYGVYMYSGGNHTVRNTTCNGNSNGMYLYSSKDNIIDNNTMDDNINHGIYLYSAADRNVITGNVAERNRNYGIYLYTNPSNNLIKGNRLYDNWARGIYLATNCLNNTILGNVAGNTVGTLEDYGIIVTGSSHGTTIANNTIERVFTHGIYLTASECIVTGNIVNGSGGHGIYLNTITTAIIDNNTVLGCVTGIGMISTSGIMITDHLVSGVTTAGIAVGSNCDNNNFTGIRVENVAGTGVTITAATSNNNLFFMNYFINCITFGNDAGIGNYWDNGSIGNYWGDYSGPDADVNAIGDTPYPVAPNGVDNYPLLITDFALLADADGDGLNGYQEITGVANPYGNEPTNPANPDSDGDGIPDGEEVIPGLDGQVTNPNSDDTDGDGLPDAWEIYFGLNATNHADASIDNDGDGLTALEEFETNTDPWDADTDGDGIPDGEEVTPGTDGFVTDPLNDDTDDDGFPDGMETGAGTDPTDRWSYPKPDLAITTHILSGNVLDVTIKNEGTLGAVDIIIQVNITSAGFSISKDPFTTVSLAAGASVVVRVDFIADIGQLAPGVNYIVSVAIDPSDHVNETREDNNVLGGIVYHVDASNGSMVPADWLLVTIIGFSGAIVAVAGISATRVKRVKGELAEATRKLSAKNSGEREGQPDGAVPRER